MYGYDSEKLLAGAVVKKVLINDKFLVFITDRGDLAYEVEGDCCSHSQFEMFRGAHKLIGEKVSEMRPAKQQHPKSAPVPDENVYPDSYDDYQDAVSVYPYEILVNDLPVVFFEFRNYSNGYYYGGWMQRKEEMSASEFDALNHVTKHWKNS